MPICRNDFTLGGASFVSSMDPNAETFTLQLPENLRLLDLCGSAGILLMLLAAVVF
jgi:hypothetical protein